MKGGVWGMWIFGTILLFTTAVLWFALTPFYITYSTQAAITGNLSDLTTNTSFHNLMSYNNTIWDMWPIALFVVVFLFFIIISQDEEDYRGGGFS